MSCTCFSTRRRNMLLEFNVINFGCIENVHDASQITIAYFDDASKMHMTRPRTYIPFELLNGALTLSDPGYFRQLANDLGAVNTNYGPHTFSKTTVSIFTISYMCILLGVSGMFRLQFFKNSPF